MDQGSFAITKSLFGYHDSWDSDPTNVPFFKSPDGTASWVSITCKTHYANDFWLLQLQFLQFALTIPSSSWLFQRAIPPLAKHSGLTLKLGNSSHSCTIIGQEAMVQETSGQTPTTLLLLILHHIYLKGPQKQALCAKASGPRYVPMFFLSFLSLFMLLR